MVISELPMYNRNLPKWEVTYQFELKSEKPIFQNLGARNKLKQYYEEKVMRSNEASRHHFSN